MRVKKKNCKIFLEGTLPIFIKSIKHKQIVDLLIPYLTNLSRYYSFPGGSVVKNLPANTREAGSIPRSGWSPRERNGNPPLPGKSHIQRSLAGYSTWGLERVRHDLVTKQQDLKILDKWSSMYIKTVHNVILKFELLFR